MEFRTTLNPTKSNITIGYDDSILTIGSCFAENMGARLSALRFSTLTNPFGIIYNPISISTGITKLLTEEIYTEKDIFQNGDLWHSWQHHSKFSMPKKDDILRGINDSLLEATTFFQKANRLIITLGTANVFIEKKSGEVVANCHKVPSRNLETGLDNFDKKRLSIEEIVESFTDILNKINAQNTGIQIIITVSPIRHIRDGLIENQRSKATLLLAVEEICRQFQNVHYFPAYELMMDDLRDYRFYEADMIHPSSQAIDYIWDYFKEVFFTNKTNCVVNDVQKMNAMLQHRPLHPNTEGYQQFVNSVNNKMIELKTKYPYLKFE